MTTERLLALALATLVFCAPSLASAQHEPMPVEHVHVAEATSAHATHAAHARTTDATPHLADRSERLHPPSAGDYVLPIGGIVLGGAMVIAGAVVAVFAGLIALVEHVESDTSTVSSWVFGVSLGGAALGALVLGLSASSLAGVRHRARETEGVNLAGVSVAPTEGGVAVTAWGTF